MAIMLSTCTARARLVGSPVPAILSRRRKTQRLIPGLRNPALHGIPNDGKVPHRAASWVCWKVHASSALNSMSFTQIRRNTAPRTMAATKPANQSRLSTQLQADAAKTSIYFQVGTGRADFKKIGLCMPIALDRGSARPYSPAPL